MRGDDEHQTAHTPIALMLCSKLENLATMPRRAQAQHKCEDNIIRVIHREIFPSNHALQIICHTDTKSEND